MFGKIDLGQNYPQIFVWVKISEKCRLESKISKNPDFGQHFENIDFGENCLKISNLIENWSKILDFGQNYKKKCRF